MGEHGNDITLFPSLSQLCPRATGCLASRPSSLPHDVNWNRVELSWTPVWAVYLVLKGDTVGDELCSQESRQRTRQTLLLPLANPGNSLPLRLPSLPHPHPHLSKKGCSGNSLVVQWLRPHASTAGNMDLIRGGKTKNPHAISESESLSVVSNSLRPHGLYSPMNSLHQNTGVGSLSLLQGICPTQGSNTGILHCRRILYQLSHKGLDMAKKKKRAVPP